MINLNTPYPRGHSHWKVVWGRANLKTPFFWPNFSSGDPPFQAFFPLRSPRLDFLKKNLHFKTNFCRYLAPETQILAKICSRDPSFKPKIIRNQFWRQYFWKPGWHLPTQTFGDPPRTHIIYTSKHIKEWNYDKIYQQLRSMSCIKNSRFLSSWMMCMLMLMNSLEPGEHWHTWFD